jgi:hypothetical protein
LRGVGDSGRVAIGLACAWAVRVVALPGAWAAAEKATSKSALLSSGAALGKRRKEFLIIASRM